MSAFSETGASVTGTVTGTVTVADSVTDTGTGTDADADAGGSHSHRRASMGSKLAARSAGYSPEPIPTAMETPNARMTDHMVTTVDQPADAATTLEMMTPTATPISPPRTLMVKLSMRKRVRMST